MQGLQCPDSTEVTTDFGNATAIVHWDVPMLYDESKDAFKANCNSSSGTNFTIGTTRVECIVTDKRGINTSCYFDITVEGRSIIKN